MHEVNWVALSIFIVLFGFITWLGFAAARWRKGEDRGGNSERVRLTYNYLILHVYLRWRPGSVYADISVNRS